MLEKLLSIKSVKRMMSQLSYEYWLQILEEDFNEESDDFVMLNRNNTVPDEYMTYMVDYGYKGNFYMKFIKIYVDNHDRMVKHFREKGNNAAISFINTVPYAFKEMIKVCSRVMEFPESRECSTIRNMTLSNEKFINYEDAILLMRIAGDDEVESIEGSDAKGFWEMFENIIDYLPTDEICSTVANNQTDITSQVNQDVYDSMTDLIGTLCTSCPDMCNATDLSEFFEVRQTRMNPLMDSIYAVGLWISVAFLAVTLLVFFLVPNLRTSVHGKCTIFHLFSMIVAYSSLAMAQYIHMTSGIYCIFNGFALQFSFLAMFFWLNVMCLDILLAFSFLKKKTGKKKKNTTTKMFLYSLYAWGVPCIILAVSLAMEYGPWLPTASDSRPGIGDPKCFFKNLRARWLYLYGPIAVLIVCNLIMFAITAIMIFKHSRSSNILRHKDSQSANKTDNARLMIYLNLFILMGVNWLGEVLAWNWPNHWIFYITDITSALQGVIVFVLFICKRRILSSLQKTMSVKFQSLRSSEEGNGTSGTQSSEMKALSPNKSSDSQQMKT